MTADNKTERETGRKAQLSNINAAKVQRAYADGCRYNSDVFGAAGDAEDVDGSNGRDSVNERW